MKIPKDRDYEYMDMYFKKGVHGLVFVWIIDRWVRTSIPLSEIKAGRARNTDNLFHNVNLSLRNNRRNRLQNER
jgi:hypothetical protein